MRQQLETSLSSRGWFRGCCRKLQALVRFIAAWSENFYHFLASFAILVGGFWVLYTFKMQRESIWNVNLSISTQSVPYDGNVYAVIVRVAWQNRGKNLVRAGEDGLRLTVVQAPKKIGSYLPLWRTGTKFVPAGKTIINRVNMLRHYKGYEIEPGAAYEETETVLAEKGDLLLIECKFYGPDEGAITQYRFAYVDSSSEFQGEETRK